ncbi:MAG TPA: putative lipopolysaccharide heptosyltransferase III [Nitrospiria bacterium]|nr:putative lipopolysaccharide heptosyltransferase III [Nitrospiria bacterium]
MFDLRVVRKVLIIKLRYIGDVVLTTPIAEALDRALPEASIDMLVNEGTEEVLQNNPHVGAVLVVPRKMGWRQIGLIRELRRKRYDLILDLTDGDRAAILGFLSGARRRIGFNHEHRWRGILYQRVVAADRATLHAVDYHRTMLQALGCDVDLKAPRLYVSERDRSQAGALLRRIRIDEDAPIFLISPGARWWFKSWPAERFGALAAEIHRTFGFFAVVVGGKKDRKEANEIMASCGAWAGSLAGESTILETAALAERAKFFVGNDAGPMHVAAAMGTPVVALFGPTDPRMWGPVGEGHRILWKGVDCSPCWRDHDCGRGDFNCMRQITVSETFEAVRSLIKERGDA